MMPAANQGVGMNMGFPDVCTTPAAPAPIPIPYPNIGMNAMAMPFVPNVLVSMAPAQNMGSKPMLTNGDNAGVAHPLFMQPGGTIMGNPLILMGCMPATHLGAPTYGNNFNNPAGAKTVPSVTNVLQGSCATLDPATTSQAAIDLHRERGTLRQQRHRILTLRLPCISLNSDRWLAEQLQQHTAGSGRGLVLDLRGNPGGSVQTAVRIATRLAASGLPIAIATDRFTASAAEMLTAMLCDDKQTTTRVFGERTFGKGRTQSFWLSHTDLRASSGITEIVRATGEPLDRVGVQPDVACSAQHATTEAVRWLRRTRN
ncbi:MAG: carboxyl-terminal processing protease [Planctomycetota bacterium]|jgi:carboxyl-terminal processing protease